MASGGVANAAQPSLIERVARAEMNIAGHEQEIGTLREIIQRDVEEIARILGITLPSQLPKPVTSALNARDQEQWDRSIIGRP